MSGARDQVDELADLDVLDARDSPGDADEREDADRRGDVDGRDADGSGDPDGAARAAEAGGPGVQVPDPAPGDDLGEGAAGAAVGDVGARSSGRPWAAIGGAMALVYVVWYIIDLTVLDLSPSLFNATHRLDGSVGMRLVFAVIFLGIVFHGLNGLRVIVEDLAPSLARHDVGLQSTVRFVTMAVWLPATLVLLWPTIRFWFAG